jgi:hypothetical protein
MRPPGVHGTAITHRGHSVSRDLANRFRSSADLSGV